MSQGWSLGRLFGFPLTLDPTAVLMLAFILFMGGWQNIVGSGVFAAAIAVAVVVHELGHAFVNRAFGWDSKIVIHGFGGVTISESDPTPWQQVAVSSAGPAMNAVQMAVAFGLLLALGHRPAYLGGITTSYPVLFLDDLFVVNLFLLVFNVLPIFPLDGSHVLQAVLHMFTPARATRITAYVGLAVGAAVCAYGAANRWWFLLILTLFLLAQNWQILKAEDA